MIDLRMGGELKKALATYCKQLQSQLVIVTDKNVDKYYGEFVSQVLAEQGHEVQKIVLAPGEQSKSREMKAFVEDCLFEMGCGRDTCLIALGGGVITDLTGFVAATYCRGIPVIYLPTSLLAMVDASIGGKTGINTPYGKNVLGSFTQPLGVFIDVAWLSTLPELEYINAFSEIIKHALVADEAYFTWLEENVSALLEREEHALTFAVKRSIEIKSAVVDKDENESGIRAILNFGHTMGHAIELCSEYSLPHGQAVAMGLVYESALSCELGMLSNDVVTRITALLERFGIDLQIPDGLDTASLQAALCHDKKARNKQPRTVLLERLGKPYCKNGWWTHAFDGAQMC